MHGSPRLHPALRGFRCLRCRAPYPVGDFFAGCAACARDGHASSVVATYAEDVPDTPKVPILDAPRLGEGGTPLLTLERVADDLEMAGVWLKAEGQNPTGSHKDRMAAQLVGRASMLGAERVLAASTGNAGVALAAYASRAGLGCTILSQAGLGGSWGEDMAALGAEVLVVPTAAERWVRMAAMVEAGEGYPATNYRTPPVGSNPFGVEGYKAVGHELADAFAGQPLDVVLVPTARGDLLWGIWQGLREAWAGSEPLRWPKMVAVEPFERAARVLDGRADYRAAFPGVTDQVAIGSPGVTWQTVHTLRASDGLAVDVGDDDADDAWAELMGMGIPLERCSAAPLAALRRLRDLGVVRPGSRAVLVGTSDGRREGPRPGRPTKGPT